MKYAITRDDGVVELHDNGYELPFGAVELSDVDYDKLMSGAYILSDGDIVANPNPSRFAEVTK